MRKMSDIVRNQDPVALPADATVRDACRHMRDHRAGAVLVTEGDRQLVGIFTGREAVHRVLAEGRSIDTTLAEVMTHDPDGITPGKKAIDALRLMEDGRYRHLPIVEDAKGRRDCFAFRLQRPRTGSPRRGDRSLGTDLNRIVDRYSNAPC